ncbi:DUF2809 domain-containing protein [Agromyces mariniharenae]|uniref:DUF2809 domain-containing protein n=1 Tax=Agromyces mariniharenae TaxID=2604423 RepID=A0A5S4V3Y5_9MICO|nr:DUF2809 domain-containing protein [Agromyces mariniharenae]TYL53847.1 DUF2809 domain-containing protein [Agromyces mariniharenae]
MSRPAATVPAVASPRAMRVRAVVGALACLGLGLGLQLLDRSSVVDLLGSVLYVMLVGLLALLMRPSLRAVTVAAIALAFATLVELLQLTAIHAAVVEAVPMAGLVLGNAFDPMDLLAYLVGAVVLVPIVAVIRRPGNAAGARDA